MQAYAKMEDGLVSEEEFSRWQSAHNVLDAAAYSRDKAAQIRAKAEDAAAEFAGPEWPEQVSVAQAAAWTAVSRLLLNLDEFITRE